MKKNPVAFLGREMGPEMQRAYAVANLLNVEGKLTPAIFDKIHTSARSPEPRRREAGFVDNGVPAEEFDGAVDSFAVSGMVSQFDRNTELQRARRAGLPGERQVHGENRIHHRVPGTVQPAGAIPAGEEKDPIQTDLVKKARRCKPAAFIYQGHARRASDLAIPLAGAGRGQTGAAVRASASQTSSSMASSRVAVWSCMEQAERDMSCCPRPPAPTTPSMVAALRFISPR